MDLWLVRTARNIIAGPYPKDQVCQLIRDGQFEQAIVLAEDVIRRYPMSPQADSLETLLPRIRELAREGVGASDTLD